MNSQLKIVLCAAFSMLAVPALAQITAKQVSGKTVTSKDATFQIGADGSLTGTNAKGEAFVGTWRVENGAWCRTFTKPKRFAGDTCQTASIKGKTLTLVPADGSSISFKMK